MDVEYVRNVFAIMYGSNAAAEEVFEVAKRSWDHSDKLFNRTFHDVIEAEIGGEERTALFTVDLSRVQNIIRHIAHALYFVETRSPALTKIDVFCGFHSRKSLHGELDGTEKLGTMLAGADYVDRTTPYPDVFAYKMHRGKDCVIFAMQFFGTLWCYAWLKV